MPETAARQTGNTSRLRAGLSHWFWAIPVLLIVAALALRQIDCCPPTTDEFYSLYNSGWLVYGPYSPLDVIRSLQTYSPDHTPGYFILLSVWGNLTLYELASGRLLSIFCGLLALTVAYRLARDFVAPEAAIFVLIILASNAFYNFYYAHTRMYTLLVLLAGSVLWLYLRSLGPSKRLRRRDCLVLGIASLLFLSLHVFSIVFMLPLAIYHLLFAPRNRQWLAVTVTGAATSLLSAPWLLAVIARGLSAAGDEMSGSTGATWEFLSAALAAFVNGQPLLLAVAAAGIFLAALAGRRLPKSILLLGAIHVALICVLGAAAPEILASNNGYRYLLPSLLVFALLVAAAVFSLYSFRTMFAVLLALWVVSGLHFQADANWRQFIGGLNKAYSMPPWQVISRLADTPPSPLIINFKLNLKSISFSYNRRIPYSQQLHYFGRKAIDILSAEDLAAATSIAANRGITQARIWILYDQRNLLAHEYDSLLWDMSRLDYDLCETTPIGARWTILDFYWDNLDCALREPISEPRTAMTGHKFYDARLSLDGAQLSFVDSWSASADFESEYFAMSYQLLSEDWDNVAQLDLPLVHEGLTRRFSIETRDLPPGLYRLMLILYDTRTGKPLEWIDNPGYAPGLIELSEVVIPD